MANPTNKPPRSQASSRFSRESIFLTPEEVAAILRVPSADLSGQGFHVPMAGMRVVSGASCGPFRQTTTH